MPFHHYIPAAFLASFSFENNKPRREMKIYVGDKSNKACFISPVGKVAGSNNLYRTLLGNNPNLVEETWTGYETRLPLAITKLINRQIDALLWLRVVVPFIASLFVRTVSFDKRFENRMSLLDNDKNSFAQSNDNVNGARLLEFQRLLGPILAAKWVVLSTIGLVPLITNDVGFVPYKNKVLGDSGFAIPLDQKHILVLIPMKEREIVEKRNNHWYPIIDYSTTFPKNHMELNKILSTTAERFIFGPEESLVKRLLQEEGKATPFPEPGAIGFMTGPLAGVHEFTWHRLVSALIKDEAGNRDLSFDLDIETLALGWVPPLIFPINLPEFKPALHVSGDKIIVSFYDVDGYVDYSEQYKLLTSNK